MRKVWRACKLVVGIPMFVVGFTLIELVVLMFAEVPVYVKFEDEGKEKAN